MTYGRLSILLVIASASVIILPLAADLSIISTRWSDPATWLPRAVSGAALTAWFAVVVPRPFIVIGWWLRIVLIVLTAASIAFAFTPPLRLSLTVVDNFAALGLLAAVVLALTGRRRPRQPQPIVFEQFPLTGGTFVVYHGGSNPVLNPHAREERQRYALDIVRLSGARRARGFLPQTLSAYTIWDTPVVAPYDAVVVAVEDDLPDRPIGDMDRQHPAGNHVVLAAGDTRIVLAHLRRGSIEVQETTRVRAGERIARAGNSGNTSEPHLHVHAERGGKGVPILIDGRFLVVGSVVTAPASPASRAG